MDTWRGKGCSQYTTTHTNRTHSTQTNNVDHFKQKFIYYLTILPWRPQFNQATVEVDDIKVSFFTHVAQGPY